MVSNVASICGKKVAFCQLQSQNLLTGGTGEQIRYKVDAARNLDKYTERWNIWHVYIIIYIYMFYICIVGLQFHRIWISMILDYISPVQFFSEDIMETWKVEKKWCFVVPSTQKNMSNVWKVCSNVLQTIRDWVTIIQVDKAGGFSLWSWSTLRFSRCWYTPPKVKHTSSSKMADDYHFLLGFGNFSCKLADKLRECTKLEGFLFSSELECLSRFRVVFG